MKSATILLSLLALTALSAASTNMTKVYQPVIGDGPKPGETCILKQFCDRPPGFNISNYPCPDSPSFNNPYIEYFAPAPLVKPESIAEVCPHINGSEPICCNDDQVKLMSK